MQISGFKSSLEQSKNMVPFSSRLFRQITAVLVKKFLLDAETFQYYWLYLSLKINLKKKKLFPGRYLMCVSLFSSNLTYLMVPFHLLMLIDASM